MRRTLTILALAGALAGSLVTREAHASGPFCFQLTPFPNIVVWFLDSAGGNQFVGSGRDFTHNAAQSVTGFLTGNTFVAHFSTAAGPGPTSVPYIASGEISVVTLTGPGRFFNVRTEGTTTSTFTFTFVACPPGALAATESPRPPSQATAGPFRLPTSVATAVGK